MNTNMCKEHSLTINQSGTEQLKIAFKGIRDRLKKQELISCPQFTEFVTSNENEYDCPEGFDRIRNTYYGKVGDYKLTRMLEQYMIQVEPKS